jgi:putative ABC transport system ATP-binding protein
MQGEMVSIIGPSGSGKTTLLNIIACLDKPTSGKVYIDGIDVTSLSDNILSMVRRYKIGMIFQEFYLLPAISALENVELPMIFNSIAKAERERRAMDLLTLVGLSERAHYTPEELSAGEQQRVAVARALANNPLVILADEPTGNLDTVSGRKIIDLLISLVVSQKKSVLLVTHDIEVAKQAHKILQLKAGVIREVEGEVY